MKGEKRVLVKIGICVGLLTLLLFIGFKINQMYGNSILINNLLSLNFIITTPWLYYILIKETKINKNTVIIALYLSIKVGSYIVPHDNNDLWIIFEYKKYLAYAMLVWGIGKVIMLFYGLVQSVHRENNVDEYLGISNAFNKLLSNKKIASFYALEFSAFYYCFIKWNQNEKIKNSFTSHKESGVIALYLAVILASVIEAGAMHLLLSRVNIRFALILLVLQFYFLITIIGHLKAIVFRHTVIKEDILTIKYGLFNDAMIPISAISSVELFSKDLDKNEAVKFALVRKLEPHNILLTLKEKMKIGLIYGKVRETDKILISVDEKQKFLDSFENLKIDLDYSCTNLVRLEK